MFDVLIESQRKSDKKGFFEQGFVSVVVHSLVIAGAVYATRGVGAANADATIDTMMVFVAEQQEQKPEEPPPLMQLDALKGFQTVLAPTEIPTEIPPINLQEHFDPKDYSGTGVEGGVAGGFDPSGVFNEAVVEERPEVLSAPQPPYPEYLRQAGITGTVMLEGIIDTLGRAERGSVKVVSSPNAGFNEAAVTTMRKALFRPARVRGRAVRVLIRLPIVFRLEGR
ncbi:MAG: energy transducer TonB [Gemmatimonadales bacterium]